MARGVALAAATAAALLAVSGAGGAQAQAPKRGGTLVVGTLREPPCLNAFMERCHQGIPPAGHIMNLVLRGAFQIGAGFTWRYDLVSDVDFTTRPPFTLTYHVRPEARWSDGRSITARDFVFTHRTLQKLAASDREPLGLEFVRSVHAIDAKTVRVVLRSRFAGWRGLFVNVLPRHALRGEDFSSVWLDRIHNPKTGAPIGSGPFLVQRREQGRALTFARNPRYWGAHRAYLDRIVLRFCAKCGEAAETLEWLRTGQLDLVMAIGGSADYVQQFRRLPGVRVLAVPGPLWEHFDIRIGRGGHPALRKKAVRQALAFGIDRPTIARRYGSLRDGFTASESAVFLSASPSYRANWSRYRHRPVLARKLLEQAGCHTGSDGVYVCDGERLALRFVTTAGPGPRERTLELVQDRLRQVGIAVTTIYAPSLVVFNQIFESGDFDLVLFNWIPGSPDFSAASVDLYGCDGRQNYSGYCQRLVTRDLDQATRILDGARLAEVLNRADAQLAKDVPTIPLVERGLLAAFNTRVRNVNLNTRAWNTFANAENWWLAEPR